MPTDTTQRSENGTSTSASQAPERLQEAASGIMDQAGRTAASQASMTMTRVSETLDQVARAVREGGSQVRRDRPEIAGIADTVAGQVQQASTYLREHDAQTVLTEMEQFARRQPALVVGGGLVAGIILGRLLRSGAEPSVDRYGRRMSSSRWYPEASTGSIPGGGYGTGYGAPYDRGSSRMAGSAADVVAVTDAASSAGTTSSRKSSGSSTLTSGTGSTSTNATKRSTSTPRRASSTGAE